MCALVVRLVCVVEHRYRPVGSARELFVCRAPEVVLSGPAGTGKSRGALEKLHAAALLTAGVRALVVRKTAASLGSTALVTFREHVARESLESGEVRFYSGSPQRAAAYMYGNGSEIVVGGIDKATRIMSSEYDLIYVQEAIELTENDWESLTTRLRNGKLSFQQIIGDTNPGPPHHWLKARCDSGRAEMIYCRHQDNPVLFDASTETWTAEGAVYLDRLNQLTGVRKLRLLGGKWAAAEGLVYDGFDPRVNTSTRFNWRSHPPNDWPRYLSVDFGYTNPFVCQWWVLDPDGRAYLYREIYHTKRLVEDHARQIVKLSKTKSGAEPSPVAVICDHDAEGRATLERGLGLPTRAATKSVLDGIEAVAARLRPAGDGHPRLFLCADAVVEKDPDLVQRHLPTSTLDEISSYVWPSKADTGVEDRKKDTLPLKVNDHGMDAKRYFVAELDLGVKPRVRFFNPL